MFSSGSIFESNRGVEQGDPLGSIYCALVLAEVMIRTRDRLDRTFDAIEGPDETTDVGIFDA